MLQAQHLVMLDCHFSWQEVMLECDSSCQVQYLVMLERNFSWQAQYWVMLEYHFSLQGRHFAMLECDFSRQASHLNTYHRFTSHLTICHCSTSKVIFYITKTDAPGKHNQPPLKRHHQTERPKAGAHKNLLLGIALVGRRVHIL